MPDTEPFTLAAALAAGHTSADVRYAVRTKHWIRMRKKVFVCAEWHAFAAKDSRTAHALEIRALLLALERTNVAAAGLSAARIHGLDLLDGAAAELVVCTDDPGVAGTHRDGYFLRPAALPPEDVETRYSVRLTTPARTVLDLAANLEFDTAVVATDSAYRLGLLDPEQFARTMGGHAGRPGIEAARAVAAFAAREAESALESLSRVAMKRLNIPMPQLQVVLADVGHPRIRVDFDWWPDLDLVGEADGLEKYLPSQGADRGRTIAALRAEKDRERRILAVRGEIVRWGWREARDPRLLAAVLLPAIARAQARISRAG